jgi:hypothetical protein
MNIWLKRRKEKKIEYYVALNIRGSIICSKVFDVVHFVSKGSIKFLTTDKKIANWAYGGGSNTELTLFVRHIQGADLEVWVLPASRVTDAHSVYSNTHYIEIRSPCLHMVKSSFIEVR